MRKKIKIFLFLLLLTCFPFEVAHAQVQINLWGKWSRLDCFKGLEISSKNQGYNKKEKKYEWIVRIKNNYNKKIHFRMSWMVGQEEQAIGNITIEAGEIFTPASFYFKAEANSIAASIVDVCFRDTWEACKDCFAECDEGLPNQPDCSKFRASKPEDSPVNSKAPPPFSMATATMEEAMDKMISHLCKLKKLYAKIKAEGDMSDADRSKKSDMEHQLKELDEEFEKKISAKDVMFNGKKMSKNKLSNYLQDEVKKCN
ncbi:MAG: hypothetical protein ABI581_14160 [Sediminibacterium sp.]